MRHEDVHLGNTDVSLAGKWPAAGCFRVSHIVKKHTALLCREGPTPRNYIRVGDAYKLNI